MGVEALRDQRMKLRNQWMEVVQHVRSGTGPPFDEQWRRYLELAAAWPETAGPMPVWWPGPEAVGRSNAGRLMSGLGLDSFAELHRWSAAHREAFWEAALEHLGIRFARRPGQILDASAGAEHARWLAGAHWSCVDACFMAEPDAVAVISGPARGGSLRRTTFAELRELVDWVAAGLRAHGYEPGDRIALYMPMTLECVAAYLGVIRAGCVVVSIADSFAASELRRRLEISGARAVITVAWLERAGKRIGLYDKVCEACALQPVQTVQTVVIAPAGSGGEARGVQGLRPGDLWWDELLAEPGSGGHGLCELDSGGPSDLVNVLFSSGTTGDPKAIPWTRLTPLKCAVDGCFHHDIRPGDVVAWPTNIGWMMGPWLIFASLMNRATVALYEGVPTGAGFVRFVGAAGVNVLGVVPSLVRAWRRLAGGNEPEWSGVRVLSSTGEASSREDALWLMSRTGYRAPLIEYCGGTEIGGGYMTGSVLQPAAPATFTTPALGLDVMVLDDRGEPVAEGGMGELYLVPPSIGLSTHLLNRDHHEVYFEGCPSGPGDEVLRRHGDQVTRLAGGFLRAEGRADDTMNLGGIKVSSLEIERVVDVDPEVLESAAVAVRPGGEGAEALVLFVVPAADLVDVGLLGQRLGSALADRLNPLFKVHDVVLAEALPRTASGKLMRRLLRERYPAAIEAQRVAGVGKAR